VAASMECMTGVRGICPPELPRHGQSPEAVASPALPARGGDIQTPLRPHHSPAGGLAPGGDRAAFYDRRFERCTDPAPNRGASPGATQPTTEPP